VCRGAHIYVLPRASSRFEQGSWYRYKMKTIPSLPSADPLSLRNDQIHPTRRQSYRWRRFHHKPRLPPLLVLSLSQRRQDELKVPDEERGCSHDLDLSESSADAGSRTGREGDKGVSVPVGPRQEAGGVEGVGVRPVKGVAAYRIRIEGGWTSVGRA
jgi:hypothetical protein